MESRNSCNSLVILLMVRKSQTTTWDVFKVIVMGYLPYQLMNAGCLVTIVPVIIPMPGTFQFLACDQKFRPIVKVVGGFLSSHEPVNRRREGISQGKESRNTFRWWFQADRFFFVPSDVFFFWKMGCGAWVMLDHVNNSLEPEKIKITGCSFEC